MAPSTSKAMGFHIPPPPRTTPEGGVKRNNPTPITTAYPLTRAHGTARNHTPHNRSHTPQCGTQPTQGTTIMSNPRNRNGNRRRLLRQRVLAAYDTCAICGKPVDKSLHTPHPLSAEVDEIIPVSRGGDPLSWHNVQLTHRRCNRLKSNKSDDYARAQLTAKPLPKATSLPLTASKW